MTITFLHAIPRIRCLFHPVCSQNFNEKVMDESSFIRCTNLCTQLIRGNFHILEVLKGMLKIRLLRDRVDACTETKLSGVRIDSVPMSFYSSQISPIEQCRTEHTGIQGNCHWPEGRRYWPMRRFQGLDTSLKNRSAALKLGPHAIIANRRKLATRLAYCYRNYTYTYKQPLTVPCRPVTTPLERVTTPLRPITALLWPVAAPLRVMSWS